MTVAEKYAVKALSHPLRIRILAYLREHDMATPTELANELRVTLGDASYHTRRLAAFGYVRLAKRSQVRGVIAHHYALRVDLEETVRSIERALLMPRTGIRAEQRAVLDAPAIGELRSECPCCTSRRPQAHG